MVIWITGISGAGKTTVCQELVQLCKKDVPELVLLDGDVVRQVYGDKLGYAEADRFTQIRRVQSLSKWLGEQKMVVLVAALFSHPELLEWNRQNLPGYFEVYLEASLDLVRSRDPKGLYARADAGNEKNVVGLDIPWHRPGTPDLMMKAGNEISPSQKALEILKHLPALQKRIQS